MKKKSLVTIVTVTYNLIEAGRKASVKRCIESVRNQSYSNVEHIIIDGASQDGTLELLKPYEEKGWIKIYSEKDSGIYDAMNKGIKHAEGDYINFLNSDDFFCHKNAVNMSIKNIEKKKADWSYANAYYENTNKEKLFWEGTLRTMPFGLFPCHQTLFVKTDALKSIGGFNTSFKANADNDSMMRLDAAGFKSVKTNKVIIYFTAGGFSSTVEKLLKKSHAECFFNAHGNKLGLSYDICESFWDVHQLSEQEKIKMAFLLKRKEWQDALLENKLCLLSNIIPSQKITYYLFCIFPLLRVKKKLNDTQIYLFSKLLIWKVKNG